MTDWQPMSTARRDGEPILVLDGEGNRMIVRYWPDATFADTDIVGGWSLDFGGDDEGAVRPDGGKWAFVGWCPLPPPENRLDKQEVTHG